MYIIKPKQFIIALVIIGSLPSLITAAPRQPLVPAGSPMSKSIHFQYALYFLKIPNKNPLKVLQKHLAKKGLKYTLVDKIPESPGKMLIQAKLEKDVLKNYLPPDLDSLKYFGHGLSRAQALALQKSPQALILNFSHPKQYVWSGLREATKLLEDLARETDGLLWDEMTREVFTADAWHDERLGKWKGGVPDISTHTTIHAYKSGEFVRAISLGMAKVGLPDVVVDNFPWSSNRNVGHIINLFSQAMAEGASFNKPGMFDLNIKAIKHPAVREPQLKALKDNAKAIAHLTLIQGVWEDGDPDNRLIEIRFDRYPGPDRHARLDAMMSALFGAEDSIAYIKHNEALIAASKAAKAKLPSLRKAFNAGLRPGEFIQVKAPFPTPDGRNEWMWVEVSKWKGNDIEGLLKNDPYDIPDLHAGQIVKVSQKDVFDYIRNYSDGTSEGNKTGEIIMKMQEQKK